MYDFRHCILGNYPGSYHSGQSCTRTCDVGIEVEADLKDSDIRMDLLQVLSIASNLQKEVLLILPSSAHITSLKHHC